MAVSKLAFVDRSVRIGGHAVAVTLAVLPVSLIAIAVCIGHHTFAVMLCVLKAALIPHAIGIDRDALPGDRTVGPLTFVAAAIGKDDLAGALGLARRKCADTRI